MRQEEDKSEDESNGQASSEQDAEESDDANDEYQGFSFMQRDVLCCIQEERHYQKDVYCFTVNPMWIYSPITIC